RDGRFPALVDQVEEKLVVETDEDRALRLAELLTRWCRQALNDPRRAEPFLARIKQLDPGHPLVHRRMASVYREHGVWDAQRDSLERALLAAKSDLDKLPLHLTLGQIYETHGKDYARATHHFESALLLDRRSMEALRGLERIARVEENFHKLAEVLDLQIDAT